MPLVRFDTIDWPAPIHPEMARMVEEDMVWLRRMGLIVDEESARSFLRQGAAEVMAYMYPNVPYDGMRLAGDGMAWTAFVDDYCSHEAADSAGIAAHIDRLAALPLAPDGTGADLDHPLSRAWLDLWAREAVGRSSEWKQRALAKWRDFIISFGEEAAARVAGRRPTLETFFSMRLRNFGVKVFLDVAEAGCGFELSPLLVEHPHVQGIADACELCCMGINDVHSYEREVAVGEHNNLVMVLQDQKGLTLDEAVGEVLRMTAGWWADLLRLQATIPELGASLQLTPQEEQQLVTYAGIARSFVEGNQTWSLQCHRYAPAGVENPRDAPYLDSMRAAARAES